VEGHACMQASMHAGILLMGGYAVVCMYVLT